MGAATIRIYLADGTPHGIRIVEKSNWTGRGVEFAHRTCLASNPLHEYPSETPPRLGEAHRAALP